LNDEVKEDEMEGHIARMGEKRNTYRVLVKKPEGNISYFIFIHPVDQNTLI
jgi:hypothetical protein